MIHKFVRKLSWDSNFFGHKIGKIKISAKSNLKDLLLHTQREGYEYLTCRISLNDRSLIRDCENQGFYLTDIGITWERSTAGIPRKHSKAERACLKDAAELISISKGLFRDSRFYHDPFFSRKQAESLFEAWVLNSLNKKSIGTFHIKGKGYIICKLSSNRTGKISLIGVAPDKQRRGIGQDLVYTALKWVKGKGIRYVTARTQAQNVIAMNFYRGLGFSVKNSDVTMGFIIK